VSYRQLHSLVGLDLPCLVVGCSDLVLDTFEVDNDTMWIAGCIIYFVALYVLFGVMSVMALTHVRTPEPRLYGMAVWF